MADVVTGSIVRNQCAKTGVQIRQVLDFYQELMNSGRNAWEAGRTDWGGGVSAAGPPFQMASRRDAGKVAWGRGTPRTPGLDHAPKPIAPRQGRGERYAMPDTMEGCGCGANREIGVPEVFAFGVPPSSGRWWRPAFLRGMPRVRIYEMPPIASLSGRAIRLHPETSPLPYAPRVWSKHFCSYVRTSDPTC